MKRIHWEGRGGGIASVFHNGHFQRSGFYNKEIYHQSSNYLPNKGNKNQIQWVAFGDVFLKCSQLFKQGINLNMILELQSRNV